MQDAPEGEMILFLGRREQPGVNPALTSSVGTGRPTARGPGTGRRGACWREDYRHMIEVNLLGAITTTEVFLDRLKNGGGDIVNISSIAGRTARAGNGIYAATKWGSTGGRNRCAKNSCPTSASR